MRKGVQEVASVEDGVHAAIIMIKNSENIGCDGRSYPVGVFERPNGSVFICTNDLVHARETIRRFVVQDKRRFGMGIVTYKDPLHLLGNNIPYAVDNGDGTGSLKGKLVGMGF